MDEKPKEWSRATVTIDVDGCAPEHMTAELEHLVTAIVDSYDDDDHETVRIRDGDATLKESNVNNMSPSLRRGAVRLSE